MGKGTGQEDIETDFILDAPSDGVVLVNDRVIRICSIRPLAEDQRRLTRRPKLIESGLQRPF